MIHLVRLCLSSSAHGTPLTLCFPNSAQDCSRKKKIFGYLVRQRVKDSPEESLGEEQLFIRGNAKAAHARGKAVVLPVLLIVVGQELQTPSKESSTPIWEMSFHVLTNMRKSLDGGYVNDRKTAYSIKYIFIVSP